MKPSTPPPTGLTSSPAHPGPTGSAFKPSSSGAAVGGRGGPDDELLIDGQEEVFSRTEVEMGRIEHGTTAGGGETPVAGAADPGNAPAPAPHGKGA